MILFCQLDWHKRPIAYLNLLDLHSHSTPNISLHFYHLYICLHLVFLPLILSVLLLSLSPSSLRLSLYLISLPFSLPIIFLFSISPSLEVSLLSWALLPRSLNLPIFFCFLWFKKKPRLQIRSCSLFFIRSSLLPQFLNLMIFFWFLLFKKNPRSQINIWKGFCFFFSFFFLVVFCFFG